MSAWSRPMITHARPLARQSISASTTAAATTAGVGSQTRLVRIFNATDALAYVALEDNNSAAVTTTTGFPVAAGQDYHLAITPGQFVAVVLAASTGTVIVSEMGL